MSALTQNPRRPQSRGIALLTVLAALAVLTIVATDLQYNARVDATLAENARDELIAYYNAKNALEIELGLLRAIRQAQGQVRQFLPGLPLTSLADMLPAECGLLGELITLEDDSPLPMQGECVAKAIPEKGKIDLNRLGAITDKVLVRNLLLRRLMDTRFDRYWEEEHGNGERVSRDELITYLADYVDPDNVREGSSVGDEDDSYARMKDRYKVKNAPFDSLQEVQLIFGIDDALFSEIEKGITVYPVGGISLQTADLETIAAVLGAAAINPTDAAFIGAPMEQLLGQIAEVRQLPLASAVLNSQGVTALAQTNGLPIDPAALHKLVDDSASLDWYTVVATGSMNAVEKRVQATFNLGANQMVYYREE